MSLTGSTILVVGLVVGSIFGFDAGVWAILAVGAITWVVQLITMAAAAAALKSFNGLKDFGGVG